MWKSIFGFFFVATCATAATLSVQVDCDGVVTTGTTAATCGAPALSGPFSFANAMTWTSGLFIQAGAGLPDNASANASVASEFVLTVTSGPAQGSFTPCFSVFLDAHSASSASASVTFGPDMMSWAGQFSGACLNGAISYNRDVPQTFPLEFSAFVGVGGTLHQQGSVSVGVSSVNPFRFYDSSGAQLSDITYTLAEVPEPKAALLLLLGLALIYGISKTRLKPSVK